jgi:hypothetical protein
MIVTVIIAAVNMFNEAVVDRVFYQMGRWNRINVRPNIENIGGADGNILHLARHP